MTKPMITSYEELMEEKARLKAKLSQHKSDMRSSFNGIKEEFNPISQFAQTTKDVWTADTSNPLIAMGIGKITDLVLKKGILRNAGFLPKLLVPLVVEKISTYLISEKAADQYANILRGAAHVLRKVEPVLEGKKGKKKKKSKYLPLPEKNVGT